MAIIRKALVRLLGTDSNKMIKKEAVYSFIILSHNLKIFTFTHGLSCFFHLSFKKKEVLIVKALTSWRQEIKKKETAYTNDDACYY